MLVVKGGVAFLSVWIVWYNLVLLKAAKRAAPWGPRSLARAASGVLYNFARWWLNFTHNGEAVAAAGLFNEGKQYVMPWHPHGQFTITALYFISHFFAVNYPGKHVQRYVCIAPLLFKVPFLSEYLLLCHARSQDRKTFDKLLATGATVSVQPGGLPEQVETDSNQERVFFPENLGFVRLAMQRGVPLLPMYCFGENQLYDTSGWTRALNKWLYSNLKVGSLIIHGLAGLPCSPMLPGPWLMPTRGRGLHVRWGRPVEVGQPVEQPSDELVAEVFELYVAELRRLFEQHKEECLPPAVAARGLEVIVRGKKGRKILPAALPSQQSQVAQPEST